MCWNNRRFTFENWLSEVVFLTTGTGSISPSEPEEETEQPAEDKCKWYFYKG